MVDRTVDAPTVRDCAKACSGFVDCLSFGFRFDAVRDSCQLSASSGRRLVPRRDLVPDARWDVYDYEDLGECRQNGGGSKEEEGSGEKFKGTVSYIIFWTSSEIIKYTANA